MPRVPWLKHQSFAMCKRWLCTGIMNYWSGVAGSTQQPLIKSKTQSDGRWNCRCLVYVELHARSAFSFLARQFSAGATRLKLLPNCKCPRWQFAIAMEFLRLRQDFSPLPKKKISPDHRSRLTMEDGSVLPVLVEKPSSATNTSANYYSIHLRSIKGETKVRWSELPEFRRPRCADWRRRRPADQKSLLSVAADVRRL